jgi:hypothetical protein
VDSLTFTHWYSGSAQSLLVVHVTGSQEQTDVPGVQVHGSAVTVPSGATTPPPVHPPDRAWQVSGAKQSSAVLHACALATQVPVVAICGGGASHFVFTGQLGAMVGTMSITQSKSPLGQSATVMQTMGLGSQIPVTGTGTGSGGSGPEFGKD